MWNERKVKVFINNFNYADFLEQAIGSALQKQPDVDEIWVCDDGSSDESVLILKQLDLHNEDLHIVLKKNGGQCSVFNDFASRVDDSDYVFFLDSDDFYPPGYVRSALEIFDRDGAGVVYSGIRNFRELEEVQDMLCIASEAKSYVLGDCSDLIYSVRRKKGDPLWIGRETSAVSMRGSSYKKLFPFPFPGDFITRADDIVAFGAVLSGMRIAFVDGLRVARRVHGNNAYFGVNLSAAENKAHTFSRERMMDFFAEREKMMKWADIGTIISQRRAIPEWVEREFRIPGLRKVLSQLVFARVGFMLRRFISNFSRAGLPR